MDWNSNQLPPHSEMDLKVSGNDRDGRPSIISILSRGSDDHTAETNFDSNENLPTSPSKSSVDKRKKTFYSSPFQTIIERTEGFIKSGLEKHRGKIRIPVWTLVFLAYNACLIYACIRDFRKAKTLLVLTIVIYVCTIYCKWISRPLWIKVGNLTAPLAKKLHKHRRIRRRVQVVLFLLAVSMFLGIDCYRTPARLQSLAGIFGLLGFGLLISKHPSRVPWYTVIWGIAIQIIFALIILRWDAGRSMFEWFGDIFDSLIDFTNAGSEFVFGKSYKDHFFAFGVMPVVVFFGFIIAALYYWGAMQFLIMKIGWLLYVVMGTSACESFCAAANIFVGMTEAPLMVKPYLEQMTAVKNEYPFEFPYCSLPSVQAVHRGLIENRPLTLYGF
ncbi:hypothetical protein RvY_04838-2 [Ramazzottius varieornatus]|uniref:Uncharacterized protein n=1 Tax=Ramazzottius varieornatus TaxID=947166 RepID=A0A1D1V249_RAMVA|nr:hypothetical protein RvY_04838-2 [Ramazzottius varieornatus]